MSIICKLKLMIKVRHPITDWTEDDLKSSGNDVYSK